MNTFDFNFHPAGDVCHTWTCKQQPTGAIGAKLYPGALVLVQALQDPTQWQDLCTPPATGLSWSQTRVLELGAGVTGLPTMATAALGASVIATDVLPFMTQLTENLAANIPTVPGEQCGWPEPGSARPAPLCWGDADSEAAFFDKLDMPPHMIIAADVVYHEPLIPLLLGMLRQLVARESWPRCSDEDWAAPTIILSYVQRFKRAKKFVKGARKWFHVRQVTGPRVVDYDVLNSQPGSIGEHIDLSSMDAHTADAASWPARRAAAAAAAATTTTTTADSAGRARAGSAASSDRSVDASDCEDDVLGACYGGSDGEDEVASILPSLATYYFVLRAKSS